MKKTKVPNWIRRPYYDNFLGLWFCPDCDFMDKQREKVKKHWQRVHQAITGEGVIM